MIELFNNIFILGLVIGFIAGGLAGIIIEAILVAGGKDNNE